MENSTEEAFTMTSHTDETDVIPSARAPDLNSRIVTGLFLWGSPVLLIPGLVGNLLSILVLMRPGLRKSATSVFLTGLALADNLLLLTGLLRLWLIYLGHPDVRRVSDVACRVHVTMTYTGRYLTRWILVCVSGERFVAVLFPTRHKRLFTRASAVITLVTLTSLVTLMCVQMYVIFGITASGRCGISAGYRGYWYDVWQRADLVIGSALPLAIMSGTTAAILLKLLLLQRGGGKGKVASLTRILLTVNVVFFCTTMPQGVVYAMGDAMQAVSYTTALLIYSVAGFLVYTNSSINFFLYVLTGRRFRREFITMVTGKTRVVPVTDATTNNTGDN